MNRLDRIIEALVGLYRKYPSLLEDKRLETEVIPEMTKWAETRGREAAVFAYPRLERIPSFHHHDYRSLSIVDTFFNKAHPEVSKHDLHAFAEPVCETSFVEGTRKAVKMLNQGYRSEYVIAHNP